MLAGEPAHQSAEGPCLGAQEPGCLFWTLWSLPVTGCGQYVNTCLSGLPSVNICSNTRQSGGNKPLSVIVLQMQNLGNITFELIVLFTHHSEWF